MALFACLSASFAHAELSISDPDKLDTILGAYIEDGYEMHNDFRGALYHQFWAEEGVE